MTRPRSIKQPGPPLDPRVIAVEARGRMISIELRAGENLLAELRRGFEVEGFAGGVANLGALALGPFGYVMPALSKTGENAAFYSDTFRPAGISRLEGGAVTVGERDGAPFFHCHAIWREADGKRNGGHILPEETIVAETARIEALAIDGAVFDARLDAETNFKLFAPYATAMRGAQTDRRVLALRLKPNQDFLGTLAATAAERGISRARIRGGVGSTIGAALDGCETVENFATEVFILQGAIARDGDGALGADASAALVDYTGGLAQGSIVNGANPVLMTFELVLDIEE